MVRQVVLDTETTGLEPSQGHRIIEIGCVELVDRKLTGRHYHQYINPDREVDAGAMEVHGITNEFLADKPRFEQIADEFMAFIDGAELVIHNAPFDVGFIDHEFTQLTPKLPPVGERCRILDSLVLARHMHPGQRNSLDALCQRYHVDNSSRDLHGALLDAEILADVYLLMTGGQTALALAEDSNDNNGEQNDSSGRIKRLSSDRPALRVISATAEEQAEHLDVLGEVAKSAGGEAMWAVSPEP